MDYDLKNLHTMVVFGGSSDIARALTKKLCAINVHEVVLAGRSQELLDDACREAEDYGATRTDTVLFDAEAPLDAQRAVSDAFAKVEGTIDLVVVAVGLLDPQDEIENDPTAATRMMNVNFTWPVAALTEIRRRLVAQGSGRILVMSSAAAIRVRRVMYFYSGAKAGLDRLCTGMSHSLDGTGVTLQLLRPAVVRTKMTAGLPEPPFTTGPNEVADNVLAGLVTGQHVIWSPPALRYVFFFLRHLPTSWWRRLADR